jgi:hypothetical protein
MSGRADAYFGFQLFPIQARTAAKIRNAAITIPRYKAPPVDILRSSKIRFGIASLPARPWR